MLPANFKDCLVETVASALERMAFMVGEPIDEISDAEGRASCIRVTVDGANYQVCVRATDGALLELLASLVDSESFDDEEAQLAVNELANVLGGEILRVLGGDLRPSELGLPKSGDTVDEDERTIRCALDFMGETITVGVTPIGACA